MPIVELHFHYSSSLFVDHCCMVFPDPVIAALRLLLYLFYEGAGQACDYCGFYVPLPSRVFSSCFDTSVVVIKKFSSAVYPGTKAAITGNRFFL